jgi:hypothetical protein
VQEGKQVEHPVVIAILAGRDGLVPEGLDKLPCPRVGRGETGHGIHGYESRRVIGAELNAV